MSLKFRTGRFVVDTRWPDGLRTRFKRKSEEKARELDLRISLAIVDGSCQGLRASLETPEEPEQLISGLFRDVADLYFRDYVVAHIRSAKGKKRFLVRFKAEFGRLPFRGLTLHQVDRYIARRKQDEVKNATINREISTLRHLYEWGRRRGYVTAIRSPWSRSWRSRNGRGRALPTGSSKPCSLSSIRASCRSSS
jgi:hypothetical protein